MKKVLVVTSPTCEHDKMQSSIVYLCTLLSQQEIKFDILDLSGMIDYYDPPEEFLSPCSSKYWLSSKIFHDGIWLNKHTPIDNGNSYNIIYYSALFSYDILIHGRHLIEQKKMNCNCRGIIGGNALQNLNSKQLSIISEIFDEVFTGKININPNYKLIKPKLFYTIDTGNGCKWGKCIFCMSNIAGGIRSHRAVAKIVHDFETLNRSNSNIFDVMLSSDCFSYKHLKGIAEGLINAKINIPYNIMLRGETWITEDFSQLLAESGCTHVFIGAETLDDSMLKMINKGLTVKNITRAVKILSKNMEVELGLILFLPLHASINLSNQLDNIKELTLYLYGLEPEVLSVIQGTEIFLNPQKYNIKLWTNKNNIGHGWCYGLSPEVPWSFINSSDAVKWFKFYDLLRREIETIVDTKYWDSIDYIMENFNK